MHSSKDVTNPAGATILVAEDDPFLRELIVAQLRAHGYRVIEAESGDQALPLLQGGGIDALVTDISMPGELDGWGLAENARLNCPDIAVVYASSGAKADTARQVSGSLYVRKPFHPDAIIEAIRQLMPSR